MRRREFIAGLGGAAAAWPFAAGAQQPAMPVIGFLSGSPSNAELLAAFHQGLGEAGYFEGRNVVVEYREADGQYDRLPALAADLVGRQVAVIATPGGTPATLAAKAATKTIPIVFMVGGDPVEFGLARSLNRPAGNLTGVTSFTIEVVAKRLELMHELVPAADLIAVLVNPANPATEPITREMQIAARVFGVRLLILNASSQSDIEAAFATLVRERAGGLVTDPDPFFTTHRDQIVALALRHAVPTLEQTREFTAAGGLMAYGSNLQDGWRVVGNYTGRILKGEKAATCRSSRLQKSSWSSISRLRGRSG
jgi:putative ABC transport system substrate-binding protein